MDDTQDVTQSESFWAFRESLWETAASLVRKPGINWGTKPHTIMRYNKISHIHTATPSFLHFSNLHEHVFFSRDRPDPAKIPSFLAPLNGEPAH